MTTSCPCGSDRSLESCCGPYLLGERPAPTAEALMRSRYSAFVTGNVDHLERTLLPETRGDFDRTHITEWANNSEWTSLEVHATEAGLPSDTDGVVEFVARFRMAGREHVHHEISRFTQRDGHWFYVDGDMVKPQPRAVAKVGRNDPCPCGSGKKHKKCCGTAA